MANTYELGAPECLQASTVWWSCSGIVVHFTAMRTSARMHDVPACARIQQRIQRSRSIRTHEQETPKRTPRLVRAGALTREDLVEMSKRAHDAIFPAHEDSASVIGLERFSSRFVHGVLTAAPSGAGAAAQPPAAAQSPRRRRRRSTREWGSRAGVHGTHKARRASPRQAALAAPFNPAKAHGVGIKPPGSDEDASAIRLPHGQSGSLHAWNQGGGDGLTTPTTALRAAMNRALRLNDDQQTAAPSPKKAKGLDARRYLGDIADPFLRGLYGADEGFCSYSGGENMPIDEARVLGKILGFEGDLVRPSSLLASACFDCCREVGRERESLWFSAVAAVLGNRDSSLWRHLAVWEVCALCACLRVLLWCESVDPCLLADLHACMYSTLPPLTRSFAPSLPLRAQDELRGMHKTACTLMEALERDLEQWPTW